MKPSEVRALNEFQLTEHLNDLHTEWRNLRFQEAVGQLTATSRIGAIRRDIARIHTIRTERMHEAALRKALAGANE
jgi:large subunit ribosomal protein L29